MVSTIGFKRVATQPLRSMGFLTLANGRTKVDPLVSNHFDELTQASNQYRNTRLISLGETGPCGAGLQIPNNNKIFVKLESDINSHYYRVYPILLRMLMQQGLTPNEYSLIEVSSGSAGEAFAHMSKLAGFDAHCILPSELSQTRRNIVSAKGGVIHLPDPSIDGLGLPGAVNKLKRMLAEKTIKGKRLITINHSQVIETMHALAGILFEILPYLSSRSLNKFDVFVGVAGNGSTLYSIGATLKHFGAVDKIVAIEPFENPGFYELKYPGRYCAETNLALPNFSPTNSHGISIPMPGSGNYGLEFPYLKASVDTVDEVCLVKNGEWNQTQKILLEKMPMFNVGHSSAASLMIALRIAETVHDQNILIVFYDNLTNRY